MPAALICLPASQGMRSRLNGQSKRQIKRFSQFLAINACRSRRGRPLGGQLIYKTVRRRIRKAFGFPINLHRFRLAAATFWSMQDPTNVRGVKDLLGHASFATTY